jgi:hypothetical protein
MVLNPRETSSSGFRGMSLVTVAAGSSEQDEAAPGANQCP